MANDGVDGPVVIEGGKILVPHERNRDIEPSSRGTGEDWRALAVREFSALLRSFPKAVAVNIISDIFLGAVLYFGGKYPALAKDTGSLGFLMVLFFIIGCFVYSACIFNRE